MPVRVRHEVRHEGIGLVIEVRLDDFITHDKVIRLFSMLRKPVGTAAFAGPCSRRAGP